MRYRTSEAIRIRRRSTVPATDRGWEITAIGQESQQGIVLEAAEEKGPTTALKAAATTRGLSYPHK